MKILVLLTVLAFSGSPRAGANSDCQAELGGIFSAWETSTRTFNALLAHSGFRDTLTPGRLDAVASSPVPRLPWASKPTDPVEGLIYARLEKALNRGVLWEPIRETARRIRDERAKGDRDRRDGKRSTAQVWGPVPGGHNLPPELRGAIPMMDYQKTPGPDGGWSFARTADGTAYLWRTADGFPSARRIAGLIGNWLAVAPFVDRATGQPTLAEPLIASINIEAPNGENQSYILDPVTGDRLDDANAPGGTLELPDGRFGAIAPDPANPGRFRLRSFPNRPGLPVIDRLLPELPLVDDNLPILKTIHVPGGIRVLFFDHRTFLISHQSVFRIFDPLADTETRALSGIDFDPGAVEIEKFVSPADQLRSGRTFFQFRDQVGGRGPLPILEIDPLARTVRAAKLRPDSDAIPECDGRFFANFARVEGSRRWSVVDPATGQILVSDLQDSPHDMKFTWTGSGVAIAILKNVLQSRVFRVDLRVPAFAEVQAPEFVRVKDLSFSRPTSDGAYRTNVLIREDRSFYVLDPRESNLKPRLVPVSISGDVFDWVGLTSRRYGNLVLAHSDKEFELIEFETGKSLVRGQFPTALNGIRGAGGAEGFNLHDGESGALILMISQGRSQTPLQLFGTLPD